MPDEKVVEARRQTQHKLELMERYWGARCTILARTAGRFPFCPTRLWLIDTHAGAGEHASATDPDGKIEGTPALAALAARQAQRAFPGVEVRVRATDKSKEVATALLAAMRPYTGAPPDGVDVKVGNVDWVKAAPWVAAEIASEDHVHGGRPVGAGRHDHRSLWFIDPYEWQTIESQAYAEATEWRNAERQRNLTLYHSDPHGDAAQETRRLRQEQETAALTAQFIGQRVEARNRLLPQAHEALAVGNVERARIVLNAAKRVGLEDARLEHAIETTLDQTVPHRKQALEALGNIERTVDDLRLSIVTERMAAGVGSHSDQVRDSSYRKMIEWRRSQGLIVADGGSSSDKGAAAN